MGTDSAKMEAVANWRSDPDLKQVEVVVCTTSGTFAGRTYRTSRIRLLDALNKGFAIRATRIALDYVPLTDVQMFLPDGQKGALSSIHVRKTNVIFIAERGGGQPEGEGKVGKIVVVKRPLEAMIRTAPYTLQGRLHSAAWAELVTSLHQEDTFMPITKVRLTPSLPTGEDQFEFVAVNKDQVIYVGEAGGQA